MTDPAIRHMTVTAIILDGDHVLMIEHLKSGGFLPPGGHVEPNEDPIQALRREVLEETGLEIDIIAAPAFTYASARTTTLPPPFTIVVVDGIPDPETGPHTHIDPCYAARPRNRDSTAPVTDPGIGGSHWVRISDVGDLATPEEIPALIRAGAEFATRVNEGTQPQAGTR